MLPTLRSAGVWTAVEWCMRRSTRRRTTPDSMTAWILSDEPSDRYEMAQHASIKTSSSSEKMSLVRTDSAGEMSSQLGWGFLPRQKLDRVHVALRSMLILCGSLRRARSGRRAFCSRT